MQNHRETIKTLAFVGGTHGNELTGVYTIPWLLKQDWFQKSPLNLKTLIANPEAVKAGRRYVDVDLNRCFSNELLNNSDESALEYNLARDINDYLGPKNSEQAADLIVDIHNSSANMGISLIVGMMDEFLFALCHHLLNISEDVRIYSMPEDPTNSPYLPTIAKRDICLEIGPQPHGSLIAETLFQSQKMTEAIHDFCISWSDLPEENINQILIKPLPHFTQVKNLDYPRDSEDNPQAMIHPLVQSRDYNEFDFSQQSMFCDFDGVDIPNKLDGKYSPVFINEQAYYEKGIAMSLTTKETLNFKEFNSK